MAAISTVSSPWAGGSAPGGSTPGGSAPGGSAPGGSAPGGSAAVTSTLKSCRISVMMQSRAFLASDRAAYVTGEVLNVAGGAYMRN